MEYSKKTYHTPRTNIITVKTNSTLALSIPGEPNEDNFDDLWAGEYDSNEYLGSWSNIWGEIND